VALLASPLHQSRGMEQAGPAQPEHSNHAPAMVMVVDDDAEMRAFLRDLLVREGFRVHEEGGADRLIPSLESVRPDAIVLDKEMPGGNGLDLLEYIRRRHPSIPIILVTAFCGPAVRAEALRRGAAEYVEKPFRVARLLETLRALTEGRPAVKTAEA
jgi:DNA-binding NtrC family response regulator